MKTYRENFSNPFFQAAVDLMKKDATFASLMWELSYRDRTSEYLSMPTLSYNKLVDKLGQKLAKHSGFESDELALWLSHNVCYVVDYFSKFHRYGTISHKVSGLASFFRCVFLEHRIPSKEERDTMLPVICNLSFTILVPFFSLLGAVSMKPIVTGGDRIFFMAYGQVLIIMAKVITAAYRHPLGGYGIEQMRRRMGGRGIITPLRIYLSAEAIEGIGKAMVFYAIGTFLHEVYSIWELIIVSITGVIILFEIMKYATSYNRTNRRFFGNDMET